MEGRDLSKVFLVSELFVTHIGVAGIALETEVTGLVNRIHWRFRCPLSVNKNAFVETVLALSFHSQTGIKHYLFHGALPKVHDSRTFTYHVLFRNWSHAPNQDIDFDLGGVA